MGPGHRRWRPILVVMALVLGGVMLVSIGTGAVRIPPLRALTILYGAVTGADTGPEGTILLVLRLPRVLLAMVVGAALAVSGAAFQGLFRNPMADPYIIGVSAGASIGAALALALSPSFIGLWVWLTHVALPVLAFAGAMVSILVVYRLAQVGRKVPVMNLLLAGVAVSSFLTAAVSAIMITSERRLWTIMFWLMGGFSGRGWSHLAAALPLFAVGGLVVWVHSRPLNAMLLGEEPAGYLGVDVDQVKRRLLFAGGMLTAAAVAVGGVIGFVGLIVPHMVRLCVGPDHRLLVPASALAGAIFLCLSDLAARVVLAPAELPVGIVTALCGSPFFIYLLRRQTRR
ncbi:MAG: iron ABC transporter permease [Bacillota bacterium]